MGSYLHAVTLLVDVVLTSAPILGCLCSNSRHDTSFMENNFCELGQKPSPNFMILFLPVCKKLEELSHLEELVITLLFPWSAVSGVLCW